MGGRRSYKYYKYRNILRPTAMDTYMKKTIRLIVKIIATPLFILAIVALFMFLLIVSALLWLFDGSEIDREISKEIREDLIVSFKRWFTVI